MGLSKRSRERKLAMGREKSIACRLSRLMPKDVYSMLAMGREKSIACWLSQLMPKDVYSMPALGMVAQIDLKCRKEW